MSSQNILSLLEKLQSENDSEVLEALKELAMASDETVLPHIEQFLNSPNFVIQAQAEKTIEAIKEKLKKQEEQKLKEELRMKRIKEQEQLIKEEIYELSEEEMEKIRQEELARLEAEKKKLEEERKRREKEELEKKKKIEEERKKKKLMEAKKRAEQAFRMKIRQEELPKIGLINYKGKLLTKEEVEEIKRKEIERKKRELMAKKRRLKRIEKEHGEMIARHNIALEMYYKYFLLLSPICGIAFLLLIIIWLAPEIKFLAPITWVSFVISLLLDIIILYMMYDHMLKITQLRIISFEDELFLVKFKEKKYKLFELIRKVVFFRHKNLEKLINDLIVKENLRKAQQLEESE